MRIDHAEVRRIAGLACLEFDESEIVPLASQLSAILTYMESLSRLDTKDVPPTFHPVGHKGPMREDQARPGLGVREATRGAPATVEVPGGATEGRPGQFLVPKVIG